MLVLIAHPRDGGDAAGRQRSNGEAGSGRTDPPMEPLLVFRTREEPTPNASLRLVVATRNRGSDPLAFSDGSISRSIA